MRRRKLLIAAILLLMGVGCFSADWANQPFLPAINDHENVTWLECLVSTNCANVTIKENTPNDAELLRLNTDVTPTLDLSGNNPLGLRVSEDTEDPKFFLQASQPGDYELNNNVFNVIVKSGSSSFVATVSIENVNDNPPIIQFSGDCLVVEERLGETPCKITVKDYDGGACYTKMTVTDDHFELKLLDASGVNCAEATYGLEVKTKLDYETFRLHSMDIIAEDIGQVGPDPDKDILQPQFTFTTTVAYVVLVDDIPDEEPKWLKLTPSITVVELEEKTEQFTAVDGDYGLNWTIVYNLEVHEDYDEYFKMGKDSGLLEIAEIDRDNLQIDIINLRIWANEIHEAPWTEDDAMAVYADIVVLVKDINNNIPTFEPTEYSILEHPEETYFSHKIFSVFDPDLAENGTFVLNIENSEWSSNFMVVPTTGYQQMSLTVAAIDASKLDYEDKNWREIILKIKAVEVADASHTAIAELKITLKNLNDEFPEFDYDTYNVEVDENRPRDTNIVQVHAEDPDEDDIVTYSIRTTSLLMDEETGILSTINDLTFDYEKQTEMIVQVYATDLENHRTSCEVNISIKDLNDEAPILTMPRTPHDVKEHSDVGTRASDDISATDPDTSADLRFYIHWEESYAYKQGVLVDQDLFMGTVDLAQATKSGQTWTTHLIVNDKDKFDWEVFESIRLLVVVEDLETHEDYRDDKFSDSAFLTVQVEDINDCIPTFTDETPTEIEVMEEMGADILVGAVLAIDNDSAKYGTIRYSIEPLTPEDLKSVAPQLRIDENTGQLYTTSNKIDCEEFRNLEYTFSIMADDSELNSTMTLTVLIEDINDNLPKYEDQHPEDILFPKIEENNNPTELACLDANDLDMTYPFNHITYLLDSEQDNFTMSDTCLWVDLTLDREDQPYRLVHVLTRDNFLDEMSANSNFGDAVIINVTVLDINDNKPKFPNYEPLPVKETDMKAGSIVFEVVVFDPDDGENGTIKCLESPEVNLLYPTSRDLEDLFEVDTDEETKTCRVVAKVDLARRWGDYEILLEAEDGGTPFLTGNKSYTFYVSNENLNAPNIESPESGTILRLLRQDAPNIYPMNEFNDRPVPDFCASDEDDPRTNNGLLTWTLTGAEEYFDYVSTGLEGNPCIMLRKTKHIPSSLKIFEVTLQARDNAEFKPLESQKVEFSIYIIDDANNPTFYVTDFPVSFKENTTGVGTFYTIPEAVSEEQQLLPSDGRLPIYYYLYDGDVEFFELDRTTRQLTLVKQLDYEVQTEHILRAIASFDDVPPEESTGDDLLLITVTVIDVNDNPPQFVQKNFPGTFRVTDVTGTEVTRVKAEDVDVDDRPYYEYVPDSIKGVNGLEELAREDTFVVDLDTGVVKLNIAPGGRDLTGYFQFEVVAYDTEGNVDGHRDYADVTVYIVSETHQVEFHFFNDVESVQSKENEIASSLGGVLGYSCSIENIFYSQNRDDGTTTIALTHFIDEEKFSPVENSVITSKLLEGDTYAQLNLAMVNLELALTGINKPADPEEESITMIIVLAAVCAVLAVLVIVFSLAFVVRTRTLNQRLEKLTMKKFGSQESGLNREGLAVPGTNRHAMEGSNPVWNHEVDPNFDIVSQSSGDSELIGIEDSPEFGGSGKNSGFGNPAFEFSQERDLPSYSPPVYESPRRASINPLAAAAAAEKSDDPYGFTEHIGGDMDLPRRFSLNPLATEDLGELEDIVDIEDFGDIDGDSFPHNTTEPTTEL